MLKANRGSTRLFCVVGSSFRDRRSREQLTGDKTDSTPVVGRETNDQATRKDRLHATMTGSRLVIDVKFQNIILIK